MRALKPKDRMILWRARSSAGCHDLSHVRRLFFGAVDKLESALKRLRQEPRVLILRMRNVVAIDATGLNALEDLSNGCITRAIR